MKIQLSKADLEQLLGGNSEIVIALRKSIVREFTERHLKALVEDTIVEEQAERLRQWAEAEINKAADDLFGVEAFHRLDRKPYIKDRFKELVAEAATEAIDEVMTAKVQEYINYYQNQILQTISAKIELVVNEEIAKQVADGVRKQLAKMQS